MLVEKMLFKSIYLNAAIKLAGYFLSFVSLIAVSIFLEPTLRASYFIIISAIQIRFFFELGLDVVAIQTIAHSRGSKGETNARTQGIADYFYKTYLRIGILFSFIMLPLGVFYILFSGDQLAKANILTVWTATCFSVSLAIYKNGALAILEGEGQVNRANLYRLVQNLSQNLTLLILIIVTGSLLALPASILVGSLVVRVVRSRTFEVMSYQPNWRREIFPLQWRIAVSWIAGYFIFQAYPLILAQNATAIDISRFSLNFQLILSINLLCSVVISTNQSFLGHAFAQDNKVFFKKVMLSFSAYSILLYCSLATCLYLLSTSDMLFKSDNFSENLLVESDLLKLLVAGFFVQIFYALNTYYRSQRRDVLWLPSIVGAIIVLGSMANKNFEMTVSSSINTYLSCSIVCWGLIPLAMIFGEPRKNA